jgi:hypothetical protein
MAAQELDPRVVRIGIEIGGLIKWYEDLAVTAKGTKYANANQNECEVTITNLAPATRDYILTEASPYRHAGKRKRFYVAAGRKSSGASTVFVGDIVSACASQPPDITVTIKSATCDHDKGNVVQRSQPGSASMRHIAGQVAGDLGLSLNFQAPDKNIANYSFTGGALRQVDQLGMHGGCNCYVDDGSLVVKPAGKPLGGVAHVLDVDSGLVGIPEFTERGLRVKMFYDSHVKLGSGLQVRSKINPAANGTYSVYKLGFDLANRDQSFYLVAECQRV